MAIAIAYKGLAAKNWVEIMEANEYLEDIKSRLIASNAIAAFVIVEELDFGDRFKQSLNRPNELLRLEDDAHQR